MTRVAGVRSVVGALALLGILGGCGGGGGEAADDRRQVASGDSTATTIWDDPCADPTSARCADAWREQREGNLRHADRMEFLGDPAAANETADEVRDRLAPFAGSGRTPSEAEVREALRGLAEVQTSTNAVRTAGTAFAVMVDRGCVFGSIADGNVSVEVGGYVNDGGCLASYGH